MSNVAAVDKDESVTLGCDEFSITGNDLLAFLDASNVPATLLDPETSLNTPNRCFEKLASIRDGFLIMTEGGSQTPLAALLSRQVGSTKRNDSGRSLISNSPVKLMSISPDRVLLSLNCLIDPVGDSTHDLQAQLAQLLKANDDLEHLAYAACHDLRSPLRAMSTIPRWISSDVEEVLGYVPDSIQEHTEWLVGQANRLNAMLDDLLVYVTIGTSRSESTDTEIELAPFIAKIWMNIGRSANFTLSTELACEHVTLPEANFALILKHVLRNAIAHHDKETGKVQLQLYCENEGYRVIIKDDGPGIEPTCRDKVLQLFTTLKSRDSVEGSGMGLPIVRKVVESMAGEISICEGLDNRGISIDMRLWNQNCE